MRRLVTMMAAVAVAASAALAGATAAHAGVNPAFISVYPVGSACVVSANAVTGNPGSVFRLLVHNDCRVTFTDASAAPVTPAFKSGLSGDALPFTMTSLGSGPIVLAGIVYLPTSFLSPDATISVSVVDTPVTTPAPTIHDDIQQVGVPASGDCADVDPSVGHYPGAPIGGWSKSWAQWINDGKGGEVCTRELEELGTGEIILIG